MDKLPEAECQALANMLFALVRCGVALDVEWTECWLGVVGPRLADFRVEELTQVRFGVWRGGIRFLGQFQGSDAGLMFSCPTWILGEFT